MNRSRIADLSLLIVAMMWGCTFLIVQHAVKVLPPLAFNGIRFIGAAILLALIITVFYRGQWRAINRRMLLHSCLLGLFLFLGYAFQTVGLLYTTTSNTGFITGLSVVLVPFLALILLKHPISRFTWLSALLAAGGLYLLTFAGSTLVFNKGDFLVFLCAIAFALHIAYTGIFAPQYAALPLAALQMAVVGVLSCIGSLLFEDLGPIAQTMDRLVQPEVLWALLVSIGPTSAFAFWIQTVCQKYTSPSRVAVIFAMEPVFAALTGLWFGGEKLGIMASIGCLCIFTGMILAELKSAPRTVQ
ncbi:EamA family transporter [Paenibacillus sp. HJL G12]|uniref:EamA family transporter n=1 Tax=Paenibacillus dendrobii TaxID=2691084 RepID=A0A7X3II46_9BACL|nr:DMT family transporter [Paenibacillus dendrobii]MWV44373.1 EamA family transporter [Paenibacillus dendrobii]